MTAGRTFALTQSACMCDYTCVCAFISSYLITYYLSAPHALNCFMCCDEMEEIKVKNFPHFTALHKLMPSSPVKMSYREKVNFTVSLPLISRSPCPSLLLHCSSTFLLHWSGATMLHLSTTCNCSLSVAVAAAAAICQLLLAYL